MNSMTINLYRIRTLQEFSQIDQKQISITTRVVKSAQESDQAKLLLTLVKKAAELNPSEYGNHNSVTLSSEPVSNTQNMNVDIEIKGIMTDEQKQNLDTLVQHAMEFSVFYLNVDNKYRCISSGFEHKTPVAYMSIVQEITKAYLDDHIGWKLKSRKFTGVRNPNDLAPCTVKVRKLIDNQNPGITQGLIHTKGIVKYFDASAGQLKFQDQRGENHEIHFNANSFVSPHHELYYHHVNPKFKREIELAFRIVDSRKELLILEIESLQTFDDPVQYQTPQTKNTKITEEIS